MELWRCGCGDVDVEMSRCVGMEMWMCGDVDVDVWRCGCGNVYEGDPRSNANTFITL